MGKRFIMGFLDGGIFSCEIEEKGMLDFMALHGEQQYMLPDNGFVGIPEEFLTYWVKEANILKDEAVAICGVGDRDTAPQYEAMLAALRERHIPAEDGVLLNVDELQRFFAGIGKGSVEVCQDGRSLTLTGSAILQLFGKAHIQRRERLEKKVSLSVGSGTSKIPHKHKVYAPQPVSPSRVVRSSQLDEPAGGADVVKMPSANGNDFEQMIEHATENHVETTPGAKTDD